MPNRVRFYINPRNNDGDDIYDYDHVDMFSFESLKTYSSIYGPKMACGVSYWNQLVHC